MQCHGTVLPNVTDIKPLILLQFLIIRDIVTIKYIIIYWVCNVKGNEIQTERREQYAYLPYCYVCHRTDVGS